jgi:hypothetical protein
VLEAAMPLEELFRPLAGQAAFLNQLLELAQAKLGIIETQKHGPLFRSGHELRRPLHRLVDRFIARGLIPRGRRKLRLAIKGEQLRFDPFAGEDRAVHEGERLQQKRFDFLSHAAGNRCPA